MTSDVESLADLLRRVRPSSVVVITTDGTERPIATAAGRAARWGQTARVAVGMGADIDRVELRARDGSVIDTWRPTRDVMPDDVTTSTPPAPGTPPELAVATAMVAAVQSAVDHAIDRHHRTTQGVIEALVRMVESTEKRAAAIERMYVDAMRMTQSAVLARLDAEARAVEAEHAKAADDDVMTKLAPMLGPLLGGGTSSKNGAGGTGG